VVVAVLVGIARLRVLPLQQEFRLRLLSAQVVLYLLMVLIQYFHLLRQLVGALELAPVLLRLAGAVAVVVGVVRVKLLELLDKVLLAVDPEPVAITLVAVAVPEGLVK
jgi:hypothetical protein